MTVLVGLPSMADTLGVNAKTMQFDAVKVLIETELAAVNTEIYRQIESSLTLINQLAQYLIDSGGKRFRPVLALLTAKALNYQGDQHIILAALIEFIHTATLLHDDVVDSSDLRRGNKTANALWGNEASVLVGDFLFSRSFQMMVSLDQPRIIAQLANTTNALAAGEVNQLMHRHEATLDETTYYDIIRAKTAELFAAACATSAILCQADTTVETAMYDYGIALGFAFQLIDDALDYSGSEAELGKHLGDDLAEGKMTLPIIRCLEQSSPEQQAIIQQGIQQGGRNHLPSIQQAIASTDAIAYTYAAANQWVDKALSAIAILPASAYKDALAGLAHYAVKRHV